MTKPMQTEKQKNLKKKACQAGKSSASRGCSLPADELLRIRYGEEGMDAYKKSYAKHCGTDKEQSIKKVKHAAREYAYKGKNIPSDEVLKKRYGAEYVKLYKEIYSEYYRTHNTFSDILRKKARQAGQNLAAQGRSLPSDEILKSRYGEEGVDIYKKAFAESCGTDKEQLAKKVKNAAKACASKGCNIPSDEILEKRYNAGCIALYKETYSIYYKSHHSTIQDKQRKKALRAGYNAASRGYSLPTDETLKSKYGEEGVDIYKEAYAKRGRTDDGLNISNSSTQELIPTSFEKEAPTPVQKTTNKRSWNEGVLPPSKKSASEITHVPSIDVGLIMSDEYDFFSDNAFHQDDGINNLFLNTYAETEFNPRILEKQSHKDSNSLSIRLIKEYLDDFEKLTTMPLETQVDTNNNVNTLLFNYNTDTKSHQKEGLDKNSNGSDNRSNVMHNIFLEIPSPFNK